MPRSWKYAQVNRRPKDCAFCGVEYQPLSSTQLWCIGCAPNRFFMTLIRKFGLSKPLYLELLRKQERQCAICKVRFAPGHNPGESRKFRKKPYPCVEGGEVVWLTRALRYVRAHAKAANKKERRKKNGRTSHRK